MDAVNSHNMTDLMTARRLLLRARELDARKTDPQLKTKSALDYYEEDQAILTGKESGEAQPARKAPQSPDNQVEIRLTDLIGKLKAAYSNGGDGQHFEMQAVAVEMTTVVEESLTLRYELLEPVEGLVVRNRHLAETDRYRFEFNDATTLKIVDKWTGRSTTIWGDPHVDVSDIQGNLDGDFKDLKASNSHTTFMLLDGTRLTITAEDSGVIEAVDIFKGSQHARGLGAASKSFSEKNGLFSTRVDSGTLSNVAMGDTIYAGGDGNDWFDASHRLVWGKTTGPVVTSRPSSILELEYNYRMQQQVTISQIQVNI